MSGGHGTDGKSETNVSQKKNNQGSTAWGKKRRKFIYYFMMRTKENSFKQNRTYIKAQ